MTAPLLSMPAVRSVYAVRDEVLGHERTMLEFERIYELYRRAPELAGQFEDGDLVYAPQWVNHHEGGSEWSRMNPARLVAKRMRLLPKNKRIEEDAS